MKLEFSQKNSKSTQISNFMKIRPVWAELFLGDGRTDTGGRTDMTKLVVTFRNFANATKSWDSVSKHNVNWNNDKWHAFILIM